MDLYQTTHHGLNRSNSPQFVWAIQPRVVVMNNGPRKGGPVDVFETLRKSPRIEDIWQVHLALAIPREVNTDDKMIANTIRGGGYFSPCGYTVDAGPLWTNRPKVHATK